MSSYFDEPDEHGTGAFVTIDFDTMLRDDHPAMLIKKFISTLNIKSFKKKYKVGKGKKGRAPKGIKMMIGLIFYGIYSRIYSAHQLDYASYNYSDFWVFTHKKRISHDKVSDFLNLHEEELMSVYLETIILAEKNDLLSFETMYQDGFFIKANASKKKNRKMSSLNKQEQKISETLENIMSKFRENEESSEAKDIKEDLNNKLNKIFSLKNELNNKIEDRENRKRKDKINKEEISINETDKDSSLMKMKDKSYFNAYLKITATDSKADIIVGSRLDGNCDESHNAVKLFKQANNNCKGLGVYKKVCFDSGFNTMGTSTAFEAMKVIAIAPTKDYENQTRHPEKHKDKIKFHYDDKNNRVICSEGMILFEKSKYYDMEKQALLLIFANPEVCQSCKKLSECTSSKDGYRTVRVDSRTPCQQRVLENYKSKEGQKIYQKRSHAAETFQGDLKKNGKFERFYRRGFQKVEIESILHDTVWNLRRIFNTKGGEVIWNAT